MINRSSLFNKYYRYRALFCVFTVLSLVVAVYAGINLEGVENRMVIPVSPFEKASLFQGVIRINILDIVMFALFSVPLSNGVRIGVSSAVFFYRGLVVGNGFKVFFENSVGGTAIGVFVSYCAVTLFALLYDSYLNTTGNKSTPVRILCYFAATGAAIVLRTLPMLLM